MFAYEHSSPPKPLLSLHPFPFELNSSILNLAQIKRLFILLDTPILINSKTTLPVLTVIPSRFLMKLKFEAKQRGLILHDIRLSGGAASFVLDPLGDFAYRDLDFLISIDDVTSESNWSNIKQAVFAALPFFNKEKSSLSTEIYTDKIIRIITEYDRWGLISLRNADGRNLELKFVEHMKRQYQFSVDSFQILLDPLITRTMDMNFPSILVSSSYGHFSEAFHHLHYRLIALKAPEELRGGGLLKYCDLIARGFRSINQNQMKDLQRYMCSRFFIDFRDSQTQEDILLKYVTSHFGNDYEIRYRFLRCLYEIISTDRIWLSAFERICFLRIISMMSVNMMNERLRMNFVLVKSMNKNEESFIPSVPSSNSLMKNCSDNGNHVLLLPSSTSLSIDIFVQIVNSLRTEFFPKLNHFLSSMSIDK